jgi:hypothetical protein
MVKLGPDWDKAYMDRLGEEECFEEALALAKVSNAKELEEVNLSLS